jgi:RNA polymerase sigma factor (sigma-70 family)
VERESDEAVYAKYADELIRFANALVGPSDAPDVLSTAVLRSLTSRGWADVRDPRAYLTRAVLNEARANYRSTMRRRAREERAASRDGIEPPEIRPEVLEVVGTLSMRQRAVVVLTYWDDLDVDEIARRLGISSGAVRKHLARGRARLKELLDDES